MSTYINAVVCNAIYNACLQNVTFCTAHGLAMDFSLALTYHNENKVEFITRQKLRM